MPYSAHLMSVKIQLFHQEKEHPHKIKMPKIRLKSKKKHRVPLQIPRGQCFKYTAFQKIDFEPACIAQSTGKDRQENHP